MRWSDNLDLDHIAHNHKWVRDRNPLAIDSLINLQLTHHGCNINKLVKDKYKKRTTTYRLARVENFLINHPKMAEFVNNPGEML